MIPVKQGCLQFKSRFLLDTDGSFVSAYLDWTLEFGGTWKITVLVNWPPCLCLVGTYVINSTRIRVTLICGIISSLMVNGTTSLAVFNHVSPFVSPLFLFFFFFAKTKKGWTLDARIMHVILWQCEVTSGYSLPNITWFLLFI